MKTIEIPKGYNIISAATLAINESQKYQTPVVFNFNEILIIASPQSFCDDLAQIFYLKCLLQKQGNKGGIKHGF